MDNSSKKHICYVKIIINPRINKSFILKFESFPKKCIFLKINIQYISDLDFIINEIKSQISIKEDFTVQFNWKNVPKNIIKNQKFCDSIFKIFNLKNKSFDHANINLVDIVKKHIDLYGTHPDFKNFNYNNKIKLHNYIKSILGIPKLTLDQSLKIVELVNKE